MTGEGRRALTIRAGLDQILEEILHWEGGEALEEVAQGSCGCLVPGGAQDQVGGGIVKCGQANGVHANGRRLRTR